MITRVLSFGRRKKPTSKTPESTPKAAAPSSAPAPEPEYAKPYSEHPEAIALPQSLPPLTDEDRKKMHLTRLSTDDEEMAKWLAEQGVDVSHIGAFQRGSSLLEPDTPTAAKAKASRSCRC